MLLNWLSRLRDVVYTLGVKLGEKNKCLFEECAI